MCFSPYSISYTLCGKTHTHVYGLSTKRRNNNNNNTSTYVCLTSRKMRLACMQQVFVVCSKHTKKVTGFVCASAHVWYLFIFICMYVYIKSFYMKIAYNVMALLIHICTKTSLKCTACIIKIFKDTN